MAVAHTRNATIDQLRTEGFLFYSVMQYSLKQYIHPGGRTVLCGQVGPGQQPLITLVVTMGYESIVRPLQPLHHGLTLPFTSYNRPVR